MNGQEKSGRMAGQLGSHFMLLFKETSQQTVFFLGLITSTDPVLEKGSKLKLF